MARTLNSRPDTASQPLDHRLQRRSLDQARVLRGAVSRGSKSWSILSVRRTTTSARAEHLVAVLGARSGTGRAIADLDEVLVIARREQDASCLCELTRRRCSASTLVVFATDRYADFRRFCHRQPSTVGDQVRHHGCGVILGTRLRRVRDVSEPETDCSCMERIGRVSRRGAPGDHAPTRARTDEALQPRQ